MKPGLDACVFYLSADGRRSLCRHRATRWIIVPPVSNCKIESFCEVHYGTITTSYGLPCVEMTREEAVVHEVMGS